MDNNDNNIESLDDVETLDSPSNENKVDNTMSDFKVFEINQDDNAETKENETLVKEEFVPPVNSTISSTQENQDIDPITKEPIKRTEAEKKVNEQLHTTRYPTMNQQRYSINNQVRIHEIEEQQPKSFWKDMVKNKVLKPSIILILVSIINEFFVTPYLMFKVLEELLEKLFKTAIGGGSEIMMKLYTVIGDTVVIGLAIFAFALLIFAIINFVRKGEYIDDLTHKVLKVLIYSVFVGFIICACDVFLKTSIQNIVFKIVTFNQLSIWTLGLVIK